MIEKLKISAIYDDFIRNVKLTDEQIRILDMMINKDTIVKMSMKIKYVSLRNMLNKH